MVEVSKPEEKLVKILVVGVGGGGNNVVNHMIDEGIDSVDYISVNTDAQDLQVNKANRTIQIGEKVAAGLGAGANPTKGQEAALESQEMIAEELRGADMVFVTCGMGGGTGTGAAPVVAKIAKDQGILTVGVVTKPFFWENRTEVAEAGIAVMKESVDTLIVIPNDNIAKMISKNTDYDEAMAMVDEVLMNAVRGLTDLINKQGKPNLDFSDVSTVMRDKGIAYIGMGSAKGEQSALEATKFAVDSQLLDNSVSGASNIIISICGGAGFNDCAEAASYVRDMVAPRAGVFFGRIDSDSDETTVTVIATGMPEAADNQQAQTQSPFMNGFRNSGNNGRITPINQGVVTPNPANTATPNPALNRSGFAGVGGFGVGSTTPTYGATGSSFGSYGAGASAAPNPSAGASSIPNPSIGGIPTPPQPKATVAATELNVPNFLSRK